MLIMPVRCAGFDQPREPFPNIWRPCRRNALGSDRFCRRHRTALDGAILGLLQLEFHHARALSESTSRNSAAPHGDSAAAGGRTVACSTCGTLWEEASLIRRQQLLECEADYVFQPPFFGGNASERRASGEPDRESPARAFPGARSASANAKPRDS